MTPRYGFCLLLPLTLLGVSLAQEPAVFTPPQAYPVQRYESGWNKNPFTLKTVAPIVAQMSFAKDLAIGAHYGAVDNPTVVIVNTKTNERTLLRKDQPAANGMRLKSVHFASSRKECQVEVLLGAEAAVLAYDSNYLGQLAASETTRMAAAKTAASPAKKALTLPPLPLSKPAPAPSAVITSQPFSPPSASASTPSRLRYAAPPPQ